MTIKDSLEKGTNETVARLQQQKILNKSKNSGFRKFRNKLSSLLRTPKTGSKKMEEEIEELNSQSKPAKLKEGK